MLAITNMHGEREDGPAQVCRNRQPMLESWINDTRSRHSHVTNEMHVNRSYRASPYHSDRSKSTEEPRNKVYKGHLIEGFILGNSKIV